MDVETDYLRSRSLKSCKDIFHVMKKYGYYNNVMSLSSEFNRVKKFLNLLEDRSLGKQIDINDKTLPNPRLMPIFPGIRNQFIHNSENFQCLKILEDNYHIIKKEALSLDNKKDYIEYGTSFMEKGSWSIHLFSYMGINIDSNCKLCPKTAEILDSLPNRCQIYPWGDAIFSVLQPGAHIPPHSSIDNLRVRCMFGIEVPEDCEMRVGTKITRWENGKTLIFDDSFEHEVWHRGNSRRVVLIFDFWHPDLTQNEIELLTVGFNHPEVREIIYDALQNSTEEYNKYLNLSRKKGQDSKRFNYFWNKEQ